jgi:RNase P/RNase MRP subunit p29
MQLTFEEAKLLIGQKVKIVAEKDIATEFKEGIVVEGTLICIDYNAEITEKGEKILSFTSDVDVPAKDGGVYHFTVEKIYSPDTKHTDLKQIYLAERIGKLNVELATLNAELTKEKGGV